MSNYLLLIAGLSYSIHSETIDCPSSGNCGPCTNLNDGETCTLDCTGDQHCHYFQSVTCTDGHPCEVLCTGENSCQQLSVYANKATSLSMVCDSKRTNSNGNNNCCILTNVYAGNVSGNVDIDCTSPGQSTVEYNGNCARMNVTCGPGDCSIDCDASNYWSCPHTIIDATLSSSFTCTGAGCSRIANTITSEPTPSPTTSNPTTNSPTTSEPTSASPTTATPTSSAPTSNNPTTASPTTDNPTTSSPNTSSPTTSIPTALSPVTLSPTTPSLSTSSPTTYHPTATSPSSSAPTTITPTTETPTTSSLLTSPPTSAASRTNNPTTSQQSTQAPTISDIAINISTTFVSTANPTPDTNLEVPFQTTSAPTTASMNMGEGEAGDTNNASSEKQNNAETKNNQSIFGLDEISVYAIIASVIFCYICCGFILFAIHRRKANSNISKQNSDKFRQNDYAIHTGSRTTSPHNTSTSPYRINSASSTVPNSVSINGYSPRSTDRAFNTNDLKDLNLDEDIGNKGKNNTSEVFRHMSSLAATDVIMMDDIVNEMETPMGPQCGSVGANDIDTDQMGVFQGELGGDDIPPPPPSQPVMHNRFASVQSVASDYEIEMTDIVTPNGANEDMKDHDYGNGDNNESGEEMDDDDNDKDVLPTKGNDDGIAADEFVVEGDEEMNYMQADEFVINGDSEMNLNGKTMGGNGNYNRTLGQ